MSKTYLGLHPNDLNRTDYGKIVLYVEGVPVATFEDDGNVTITGDLAIDGITNVSASIAAANNYDSGSFVKTASVSNDTITFTKGDGSTFDLTINNVESASYASSVDTTSAAFLSGTRAAFSFNDTSGANGLNFTADGNGNVSAILNEYQIQLGSTTVSLGDVVSTIAGLTLTGATVSGDFTGDLTGNADTATSASHASRSDFALDADTSTSASYADTSVSSSHADRAALAVTSITATTTTSASHAERADFALDADTSTSASHSERADLALQALSAPTGSLLKNATVSNATLTFTRGDGTTFNRIINNVASTTSASHANSATSASHADRATFAIDATTASTASSADDFEVRGDLTVEGIVTAKEFHTQFVSASIVYQSGSTQFGDSADDTHTFSGSVNVDGDVTSTDINIDGWGSISASLATLEQGTAAVNLQDVTDNGSTTTQSITAADISIDDWGSVSASLATLDNSLSGSSDLQGITDNGNSTTNVISASGFYLNQPNLNTRVAYFDGRNVTGSKGVKIGWNVSNGEHDLVVNSQILNDSKVVISTRNGVPSFDLRRDSGSNDGYLTAIVGDENLSLIQASHELDISAGAYERTRLIGGQVVLSLADYTASFNQSLRVLGPITAISSNVDADDVTINAWGSVSASLASIQAGAVSASYAASATSASFAISALTASYALNVDPIDTGSLLGNATVSNATLTFTRGDGTTFGRTINNVVNATTASYVATASYALNVDQIDTGSFITNATVSDDTLTFTQGDGTTFNRTIDNVNSASYASVAAVALNVVAPETGSFVTNVTVSDDTLTFTQGDGTTFDRTVNNVVSADSASYVLSAVSASHASSATSASFALTATTASFALAATSASHALQSDSTVSSSFATSANSAISASHAERADYAEEANIALNAPTGSLLNNATVSDATLTFTKGDGTTFDRTVNNVANAATASQAGTATSSSYAAQATSATSASFASSATSASHAERADFALEAATATNAPTGSLLTNATVSNATLTFTKGDGTTFNRTVNNVVTAQTASYVGNAISASHADRATLAITAETASSADTFLVREDATVKGDLTVEGIVTAKEFHTTFVSASIVYSSGSTKFGDTDDDIHSFTGSVNVRGEVDANDVTIDDWGSISASLAAIEVTAGGVPTLQQVTNQGSTTTNGISIDNSTLGEYGLSIIGNTDYPLVVSSSNLTGDPYLKVGSEGMISVDSHTSKFTLYVSTNGGQTLYRSFEARTTGIYSTGSVSAGGNVNAGERLTIGIVDNATTDLDKFLVLDGSGDVKYRTGAQLASDISANLNTPTLDQVTDQGSTTTNGIEVGAITTTASASIGTTLNIGTVDNANTDTDKFLVLSLDGGVRHRTGAQVASDIGALTSAPNLQAVTDIGATTTNSLTAAGLNLTSVSNAGTDTDKFLVLDSSGNVDYRTGAEVLSDIGAGGATLDLQDVTDNGSTTTNAITTAGLNLSTINNAGEDTDKFLVIDSSGNVEFRTGAEVLSDIGASTAVTLQDVTDNGNTTTNSITGSAFNITSIVNANEDTDKFLVIDSDGNVEYRTGTELVSDLDIATASFDGNRGVTNPLLPDLLNYNPGTNNVVDFLEQVFYPDAAAGIDILSNEPFYIVESELSGSDIVTGTNGYSGAQARFTSPVAVNWSLQTNSYLSIDSNGYLSLKTDLSGSSAQAPQTIAGTVIATGQLGGSKSRNFVVTIAEDPNPVINVLNANGIVHKAAHKTTPSSPASASFPNDSIPVELFIADPIAVSYAGYPTITNVTGSGTEYFTIEADPNRQVTSSSNKTNYYTLFRTAAINSGSYTLEVTGSDDYANVVSSSITIVVNANAVPTVSQTTIYVPEANATNGSTLGTITAVDSQGEDVELDSLSGTDASKFTTQINGSVGSTSAYFLKAAQDLTAEVFDVTASFSDDFGHVVNFPITAEVYAAAPSKPQPNGTFRIIESALSGSDVTTATSGIAGTKAKLTTDQEVTWSISPDTVLAISQSGEISVAVNISGSYNVGDLILATVTATNASSLTNSTDITVNVADNVDPAISTDLTGSIPHIQTLSSGKKIGTVTISDPQAYENVEENGLTGTDAAKFSLSTETPGQSVVYDLTSTQALNSGSYSVTINAIDAFNQTASQNVTITVAENTPPTFAFVSSTGTYSNFNFDIDVVDAVNDANVGVVRLETPAAEKDTVDGIVLLGSDAGSFSLDTITTTDTLITRWLRPTTDLSAGTYNLVVSGSDSFGYQVTQSLTVTVQAQAPIIDSNDPFYIIESAESGSFVTTATSGIPGTKGLLTANQDVTWSLSANNWLAISQSGELTVKAHISGSTKQAGSQLQATATAENTFGLTSNFSVIVYVTDNEPPAFTDTLITSRNNNQTTAATGFGIITVTDPQGIDNVSITDFNGADVSSFTFTPTPPGSIRNYAVSSSAALNSGSYFFSVTASDGYNDPTDTSYTLTVVENLPPVITLTGFSKTTNQATNGATIGTALASDPQDDSISSFSLSGTDASKFTAVLTNTTATSKEYNINSTQDLSAGNYNLTGSATDSFGLTTVKPIPVVISANTPDVPEKSHAQFYIIESATGSTAITGDSSGIPGSLARMTTDQSVSWSIDPYSAYIAIDSDGYLSVRNPVSGSTKVNGSEIIATVKATNVYNESVTRQIDVDVTENLPPVFSYTGLSQQEVNATDGDTVGTVTATDPQSLDGISSIVISGGANQNDFILVNTGTTATSKTYNINVDGTDLTQGTYTIELTATDTFNKTTVDTKTITVTANTAPVEKVYAYYSTVNNTDLDNTDAKALEVLGLVDYTSIGYGLYEIPGYPRTEWISGSIGSNIVVSGAGTATFVTSSAVSNLLDIKDAIGDIQIPTGGAQIIFLFPSSSNLSSLPDDMYNGSDFTQATAGQHSLITYATTPPSVTSATPHYFSLVSGTTVDGHSEWGMVVTRTAATGTNKWTIAAAGDTLP